jgi:hypothetical protein
MPSSDTLNLFSNLPRRIQRTIDHAFDISINPNQTDSGRRPLKRRRISIEPSVGGFVVEPSSPECTNTQMPLDLIPSALQHLDIPADDEEVLSVFSNAASGWASGSSEPRTASNSERKCVSRDDWRAVCAVLLENRPPDDQDSDHVNDDEFDVGGTSDEYVDDYDKPEGIPSPASDDNYYDGERDGPSSRRRKAKSRQVTSFDVLDVLDMQAHNLTHRQKQTCLDTFALFFPHISASNLENQRIAIKDLQSVAKILNEKLKANDVGLFSSCFLKLLTKVNVLDAGDAGDVLDFNRQINGL